MPPIVARLEVEVSGPKPKPWRWAARLRSSCTTPGWTWTRRASVSSSPIACMWREVSSTRPPAPIVWPARLVPAPRAITGTSKRPAVTIAAATSSASRGNATAMGLAGVHARVAGEQMQGLRVGAHVAAQLAPQGGVQLGGRSGPPWPVADLDRQSARLLPLAVYPGGACGYP